MSPLLLLAGLPALAFQPAEDVHLGREPTRVRRFHVERQYELRHGDQWQAVLSGDFDGWQARFDEATGQPWKAWGPGISLGELESATDIDRAVRGLLQRNPDLAGIDQGSLRLGDAFFHEDRNAWVVRYDQVLPGSAHPSNAELRGSEAHFEHFVAHGQPVVWRGALELGIQHGRLTQVTVKTYPDAVVAEPIVSAAQAVQIAIADGPKPSADHTIEGAARVVVPVDGPDGLAYRTAWMVRTRTAGTAPGIWVSFVDVENGELFNVHNQVRYFDGTLSAEHDTRGPNGDYSISPLTDLRVTGSEGGSSLTTATGAFSVAGTASTDFSQGADFAVYNEQGADAELSWTDTDMVWTDADASQAELDTYVFLTMVQSWASLYANDIGIVQDGMVGYVNLNNSCNAFYNGEVNFYRASGSCNNTGRIKDVVFHEWGHGMHYYAARTGYVDGAVGEGVSDVVSMLETGDHIMAPYFNTDGSGIRDLQPNRRYPEDFLGGDYVHSDGLIFGGAMWDWRQLAEARLGEEAAHALVSRVVVDGMSTNPELADTYDAMVFGDDDDGDLSNGTPNICDLIEAFGDHGLGPVGTGDGLYSVGHEVLGNQSPDATEYTLSADVLNAAPDCTDGGASAAQVVWSTDGGDTWTATDLTVTDGEASGAIPQVEPGTIVDYYVEADVGATTAAAPLHGDRHAFSFIVGDVTEIYCNDFEDSDGGWVSELLSGEPTEGANDWQWGRPLGEGGDPDFAFSGNRVWGNDLGEGEYNGEYQNDRHNRITAPAIDISGHDRVVLQYRRWLNMEDSYYDQANILANGEPIWTNHGTGRDNGEEHTTDRQWALHTLELPTDSSELELSFEIITDGGLTMGGWTIDDVCVFGISDGGAGSGEGGDGGGEDGGSDGDDSGEGGGEIPDIDTSDAADGASTDGGKVTGCACSTTDPTPGTGWLAVLGLAGIGILRRRD